MNILAAETVEQRDIRLERLRAAQQERLAAETPEQSDARLGRVKTAHQERLASSLTRDCTVAQCFEVTHRPSYLCSSVATVVGATAQ